MQTLLRRRTVTCFPGSGHDLRSPDPTMFHEAVGSFLEGLDAEAGTGTGP